MIKDKLSVKIFLITMLLLASCCSIIYFCVVHFAPYAYIHDFSDIEPMVSELEHEFSTVYKEDTTEYFANISRVIKESFDDEFSIHLFQCSGEELSLPYLDEYTGSRIEAFDGMDASEKYVIYFLNDNSQYTLFATRNTEKESQVAQALKKALPALSAVILVVSVLAAFFYSWYVTAPIKKISRLSKQMADMDFSGLCPAGRSDEIGVLSSSLNKLSSKLTAALSELQEANKMLQADIDKERELERQRLEFFSAVSHELKTPITIIKGQLQGMLCQIGRYKDRDTYLAQSLEAMGTLENRVQELLTISRLDAPGYVCTKTTFDLGELLNDRVNAHEDLLLQGDLTLKKSLSAETYLFGDAQLLQKSIDNLLANAINYSPCGEEIRIELHAACEKATLTIENTGVHIPEENLPKLFEAFYRVEQSRNRQTGGSGLGLYIVKTILDLHGAKIYISNSLHGVIATIEF